MTVDAETKNTELIQGETSGIRSDAKATSSFTVYTSAGVNVRSKPSATSSKIGSLAKGSSVRATALSNGWYTIVYNGKIGYISAQYASKTKPATTYTATTTTVYTTVTLNVRSQPSTTASKLGVLADGTAVSVKSSTNGWYMISYGGKNGYIKTEYTTSRPPAITMYTTAGLSMRSKPSTSAQRLTVIPKNTAIKVTALQNNWYTTSYSGMSGYVSAQYVTSQKPSTVIPMATASNTGMVYTTSRLNVRTQPSTGASKLGVLDKGVSVSTRGLANGWYTISYNGRQGYISSQYTSKSKPNVTNSTTASINDVISIARKYIGYPYVWGGNGPDAYDCSGFTKMLYAKNG